ncbi:uncharacterized protein LOC111744284 [Pteropus vampyrus]|uniref:Uncharacterized protein LOC111744284 n=1 Tax=Pteropus vampyrus TaxID=132908 RepID=A0A6P6CUJ7_PTEVA|nr:uncharacterized protein LOC111744284 [Pteropus vampyrus]
MHSKANPGPSKPEGRGTPRLGSHAGPVCPGPHAAACDAVTDTPLPRLQLPPPQNEAAGTWPVVAVGQRWWPGRPCRAAEARGPTRLSVPTHGGVWHVGVSGRRDGMVRRELVRLWQWGSPSVPPCPPAKGLVCTRAYPSPASQPTPAGQARHAATSLVLCSGQGSLLFRGPRGSSGDGVSRSFKWPHPQRPLCQDGRPHCRPCRP